MPFFVHGVFNPADIPVAYTLIDTPEQAHLRITTTGFTLFDKAYLPTPTLQVALVAAFREFFANQLLPAELAILKDQIITNHLTAQNLLATLRNPSPTLASILQAYRVLGIDTIDKLIN